MRTSFVALALVALIAAPAAAQVFAPTVWVEAGRSEFDLSGTGTASVYGVRSDLEINRFVVIEAGLGYTHTRQTYSDVTYLVPDLELQAQLPLGRVRPYLGVGVGQLLVVEETQRPLPEGVPSASPDGYDTSVLTFSTGARVGLSGPAYARLGVRLRGAIGDGPDFFGATIGEITLGAGYRF